MNHLDRRTALKILGCVALGGASGCAVEDQSTKREAPAADMDKLAADNNAFAFDLYGTLRTHEGNLFLSPASISTALAMTYAGADGETEKQMAKAMHFTLPEGKLHAAFASVLDELNGRRKDANQRGYQLSMANALWGQQGYAWKQEFLKVARDSYGAGLREVDFAKAAEQARQTINTWVEKQTNDKIKELLKPGILNSMTRLVLTNAIYFKGDWATQFDKKATFDQDWHATADKKVKAPMMHRTGEFRLYEDQELQVLDLPYKGKELSMFVILPRKVDGLADVEKTVTAEKLAGWAKDMRSHDRVEVTVPKFKTTAEFLLNDELKKLGMTDAFGSEANFARMNGKERDLLIAAIVHKAFVDVNEEGTEAAAATGAVVATRAAPIKQHPVFRADHPFLFLIRDNRSGGVLFLGRLADPTK
jgi:serine protease inhibitor